MSQAQAIPFVETVRRCLWCVARVGAASYFVGSDWVHLPSAVHFFGEVSFTDGFCPVCEEAELAAIKALSSGGRGVRPRAASELELEGMRHG